MTKRPCWFKEEYSKEWSYIKRGRYETEAECTLCSSIFCIGYGGRSDIKQHLTSAKHRNRLRGPSSSKSLTDIFIKPLSNEESKISAAELTQAYHMVNHHHSFTSNDCVNKLNSLMFSDSSIASKSSSARTKQSALITGVLAPFSLKTGINEINISPFYGISTDASNHKAMKLFPFVVQYFDINEGIKSTLLKVASLPCETSEAIADFCLDCITEFKLNKGSCVAFCGDNTNTSFGGLERAGARDVFTKLKASLHNHIEGVGCPVYVLHNCVGTAADRLSVNIKSIVVEIYSYFFIYTVRNESLKEFCEMVDVEFGSIMSHSKTRWWSLIPAIERIITLFDALKVYFFNEEKAPHILKTFFRNPLSEAYLCFLHSQLITISQGIEKIEGSTRSIVEINDVLENTLKAISKRKEEQFLPFSVKSILKRSEIDNLKEVDFKKEVNEFYEICIEYLGKWSASVSSFLPFKWMLLSDKPTWDNVDETLVYFNERDIIINDSLLFDQMSSLTDFVENNINQWCENTDKVLQCHEKWVSFFKAYNRPEQHSELLKICQYVFAIPAHNGNTERVFSPMNVQWTDERNKMGVDTTSAILQVKYNFKMDCSEFYTFISEQKEVLKMAGQNCEYSQQANPKDPRPK